jgi:hypothetical protein
MWDTLSSQADTGTEVSRAQFSKVFLIWQGIDEEVEAQEMNQSMLLCGGFLQCRIAPARSMRPSISASGCGMELRSDMPM